LHAKGVVALVPGFPKRYAPVPFSEFLTRMQAFHEEAAQSIVAEREELTRLFSPAKKAKPQPKATFSSVSGRGVLVAKWNEIVRRTERDLLVLATGPFAREVLGGDRLLAEAKSRGIRVRMLLPSTARVPPSGIEVARVEGHEGLSIVSADSEYVLLVSSSVTSGAEQEGEAESWGGIEAHGASAATLARLLENEWLLHGRGGIIESDQRLRHLRIEGRDETKGPELDRSP
jgi:sugar-specific transcriptional regulator TrmB